MSENNKMNTSILDTVKTNLGIDANITAFDAELILHINSVLASIVQMGIGPAEGFSISSNSETWKQFLGDDANDKYSMIITFTALKVKKIFDPQENKTVSDAIDSQLKEYEYRLLKQKEIFDELDK